MRSLYKLSHDCRAHACAGSRSIRHAGFENLLQRFFFIWLALIGPAGALAESAGQNDDGSLIASDGMLQTLIAAEAAASTDTKTLKLEPVDLANLAQNTVGLIACWP